ncbi:MAG: hypothetical protein IJM17_08965 [Firmicutes bacterium]|nr:hypothetical protein [Bacillota bacterium]
MKKKQKEESPRFSGGQIARFLTVLATVVALATGGLDLFDRFTGSKETPQEAAAPSAAVEEPLFVPAEESIEGQPSVRVRIGGWELDGRSIYTVPKGMDVHVWTDDKVSALLYSAGTKEPVRIKGASSADISFGNDIQSGSLVPLSVYAETADGSVSDPRTFSFTVCKATDEDEPLSLYAGGNHITIGGTALISEGMAVCVAEKSKDVTKLRYRIEGSEIFDVTVDFPGYMDIPLPAESPLTLKIRGIKQDGTELDLQEYKVKHPGLPELDVRFNGEVLDQRDPTIVKVPVVVSVEPPEGESVKNIIYKIGTGDIVRTGSGEAFELTIPNEYYEGNKFSFQICYLNTDGVQSAYQYYMLRIKP